MWGGSSVFDCLIVFRKRSLNLSCSVDLLAHGGGGETKLPKESRDHVELGLFFTYEFLLIERP